MVAGELIRAALRGGDPDDEDMGFTLLGEIAIRLLAL